MIERVRERADNLAGLKVSERSPADIEAFIGTGLPVLIGSEPLIPEAFAAGATGAVSGMASAYPAEVAAVVRTPSPAGADALRKLRASLEPAFIPMVKARLVTPACRPPAGRAPTAAADAVALLRQACEVPAHCLAGARAVAVVNAVDHSGHVLDHAVGDLDLAR